MSKPFYSQLQFYIKLTDIIGRTFNDIQGLLKQQLNQQITSNGHQNTMQKQIAEINKTHHFDHSAEDRFIQASNQLIDEQLINKAEYEKCKDPNKGTEIQRERKKQAYTDDSPIGEKAVKTTHRNQYQSKIYESVGQKILNESRENQPEPQKRHKVKKMQKIKKAEKNNPRLQNLNQQLKKGAKKKSVRLKKKDYAQGRPYPPLNAFMVFLLQNKHDIMRQRPELSPSEVSIYASTVWKNLEGKQKQQYLQVYRKNQEKYLEQVKKYEQKQRQQKLKNKYLSEDSNFQIEKGRDGEFDIELRSNLRTRKSRKKQGVNQIICVESEEIGEDQEGRQNQESQ